MKPDIKNQGHILFLLGYLFYVHYGPDTAASYASIICAALFFFAASLLCPFALKRMRLHRSARQLATLCESTGAILTLVFALTFIPKARFVETHLALFGLLTLTFLVTRNIFPGMPRDSQTRPDHKIKQSPARNAG